MGFRSSKPGQFNGQNDVDPFMNFVYVADYDNNRIQVFDSNGTFVTSWGTEGEGDGAVESIVIDSNDNIYEADFGNDRIQKFSKDGQFLAKWGTSGSEVGQFMGPAGLAVDLNDSTAALTVGISPDTTFYPIMTSYSKTY
jgi:tripartite motif-containing protein 71